MGEEGREGDIGGKDGLESRVGAGQRGGRMKGNILEHVICSSGD